MGPDAHYLLPRHDVTASLPPTVASTA